LVKLEEVVVGGCAYALLKSYVSHAPIVLVSSKHPTVDLKFDKAITVEQLTTVSHSEAWSMLKFLCSMRGLVVNCQDLEYVGVKENQIQFRNTTIEFERCHLFQIAQ